MLFMNTLRAVLIQGNFGTTQFRIFSLPRCYLKKCRFKHTEQYLNLHLFLRETGLSFIKDVRELKARENKI
jgi:hypothetical protein